LIARIDFPEPRTAARPISFLPKSEQFQPGPDNERGRRAIGKPVRPRSPDAVPKRAQAQSRIAIQKPARAPPPDASPKPTLSQSARDLQKPSTALPSTDGHVSNGGNKPEPSGPPPAPVPSRLSRAGPPIITVEALKADLFDASDEEGLDDAPVGAPQADDSVDDPAPIKPRADSSPAVVGAAGRPAEEEEEEEEAAGSADPSSTRRNGYEAIRGGASDADRDGAPAVSDESSFLRLEAAAKAEEEEEAAKLKGNGDEEEELNLDELLKDIGNLSGDSGSDDDSS
jgi:hypothetical protein